MPQPSPVHPQQPARQGIGTPLIELQSVDSTNNYARNLVSEGLAQHGTVIFSHEQLEGRGQRGKQWFAEKDDSILMTILANPGPLSLVEQFRLSAGIAVSVLEFFQRYAGNDCRVKWPNDIYWQDRKAGGILIENIVMGEEWKWAIIGIGVNIHQTRFPESLTNPVSLHQITGKQYDLKSLCSELCEIVQEHIGQLAGSDFERVLEWYNRNLFRRGDRVKLKKGSRVFEATIQEVSPLGELIIQHSIEDRLRFGEVEWLL